jgi:hypothetical protein
VSDDMVERARRFDRVATQRVGALNDRFLAAGRQRPAVAPQ